MITANALCRVLGAASTAVLLAGCLNHPPPPRHPGPYKKPVDAFNAVETPSNAAQVTGSGPEHPLGNDLDHLRRAREAYEHSQIMQAARQRDQQARCRQQPNAKLVPIQDGTGDKGAVYCQSQPKTVPQSSKGATSSSGQ